MNGWYTQNIFWKCQDSWRANILMTFHINLYMWPPVTGRQFNFCSVVVYNEGLMHTNVLSEKVKISEHGPFDILLTFLYWLPLDIFIHLVFREWLFFNTKWAIFQLYQVAINVRFVLVHTLSWNFIVLAHWNNCLWVTIILILSQPVFVLAL